MSKVTNSAQLPSVLEFLGWHGTFILGTVIIFKLLLEPFNEQITGGCPCTGHAVYGSFMLGLPAISIFLVAFFSYYYQDDSKPPWRALKAYYKLKRPCSYSPRSQNWEMHSGVFHQCTECQGKWHKIKTTLSFVLSFLYSLLWLALGFCHMTYYTCANVGPNPNFLVYCDNWNPPDTYNKDIALARMKSLLVGNVLLIVVIALSAAILITYLSIRSKIADINELDLEDHREGQREGSVHTPVNNFGHNSEAVTSSDTHAGMSAGMTRSTEGTPPELGGSYEGFRDRGGDVARERASPRANKPLVNIDG